jgi:hypothetical protein
MSRYLIGTLLAALAGASSGMGQGNAVKDPVKPQEAEVRFADGSVLRVHILQESLEVATKYGTLTVPANHIRRIEFAARLPEKLEGRIQAAVGRLGAGTPAARDAAVRELVEIGAPAYPALLGAARGTDAETVRLARAAMRQIRETVPPEQLRQPAGDAVHAAEFTIAGRVATEKIRARTPYFGDVELRVADLRGIRWLSAGNEHRLSVDAARYGSAHDQWMETDVTAYPNEGLRITASGQVDLWPQQPGGYLATPAGYKQAAGPGGRLPGALLGRIGENGKAFVIGERWEEVPSEEGKLYLHIVPSPWNNPSSGSYEVKVTTGQSTK